MIQSTEFTWLHLPRTGGTSTAAAFRNFQNLLPTNEHDALLIDDCSLPMKHDNFSIRSARLEKNMQPLKIVMNIRPLGEWLHSNWKWACVNKRTLSSARYEAGEYFSWRLNSWRPADWWLDYFEIDMHNTHFIRLSHLQEDWREFLENHTSYDSKKLIFSHLNGIQSAHVSRSSMESTAEAKRRNPKWSAIESQLWPDR